MRKEDEFRSVYKNNGVDSLNVGEVERRAIRRREITHQVCEFLARGGTIVRVDPGVSGRTERGFEYFRI